MNSEYIKHAQDCDAAVPGPDTPFQTRLNEFGTEGRVLAGGLALVLSCLVY